jgi:hypothetical protein
MKLVLIWLLGVPMLVTSMVLAQSLAAEQRVANNNTVETRHCSGHDDLDHMPAVVTDQGKLVSCHRLTVQ